MLTGFQIAELYVPKKELVNVCMAFLFSQDIREDSWDESKIRYSLSLSEASVQAAEEFDLPLFWAQIISAWNSSYWNEGQDFAKKIVEVYKE
jgi:hypothetical protein